MILATLCYNKHLELNNSINFSFKTPLKRNAPMPFSRHGAFFTQFLLQPLTLLFIGRRFFTLFNKYLDRSGAFLLLQNGKVHDILICTWSVDVIAVINRHV
jgi:hypothetical protein